MMTHSFADCFSDIPDHQVIRRSDYPLIEILFLCISAIVSGMKGWEDIEDFGSSKITWLRKFLPYKNGIPKHDTVVRVISIISPQALQERFVKLCFMTNIEIKSLLVRGFDALALATTK